jgi:hypothetical protein
MYLFIKKNFIAKTLYLKKFVPIQSISWTTLASHYFQISESKCIALIKTLNFEDFQTLISTIHIVLLRWLNKNENKHIKLKLCVSCCCCCCFFSTMDFYQIQKQNNFKRKKNTYLKIMCFVTMKTITRI